MVLVSAALLALPARAESLTPDQQRAHDIYKELVEIDTTTATGDTRQAAEAMAARLKAAGFPDADAQLFSPAPRKGNLVARLHGSGARKPILLVAHLDVVPALRSDWTVDPFKLTEQDGYYYGRGSSDDKYMAASFVANLIRYRKEGYKPDRDIIVALETDEEIFDHDALGIQWLLKNHRDLIDAEFALNPDSGGVSAESGKPVAVEFEATEKLYGDYQLLATNPGGHSSLPRPDNAIYHVTDALALLQKTEFPFELNPVTREYFTQMARLESGQTAADMHAILATPPDPQAIARLSQDPRYNSTMRTTCVPTMLAGGHAFNALPQRAEANVNCRIFPGHSQEEIRLELVKLINDPKLSVRYRADSGVLSDHGSERKAMTPPPVNKEVMHALTSVSRKMWPGVPVLPIMETGASDSIYTMTAGIPSYGINGVLIDRDDVRAHGKDERVNIESYYRGADFYYLFLKALTSADR
jgi:acetylornithine deacetylase/succinyl-diaminopimelate desuccinylase-like protein